eukprot:CAMPEP_0114147458 /NCGR_PEP_ID=MMETSP0043_2-20121206/21108_1 /TAXON_ID=464988 /ORGANISM="Hemiselmis andersenii, Strain CCMP644" /LENGTH=139 /DNA_ID=CAMNT_0001241979 /DNA_START=39 /DNA_END=459 /DNA_ORIENTATION=+
MEEVPTQCVCQQQKFFDPVRTMVHFDEALEVLRKDPRSATMHQRLAAYRDDEASVLAAMFSRLAIEGMSIKPVRTMVHFDEALEVLRKDPRSATMHQRLAASVRITGRNSGQPTVPRARYGGGAKKRCLEGSSIVLSRG